MNGGRNYNGPKVRKSLALVKLNYMRETPQKLSGTSSSDGSKNPAGMGTIRREDSSATMQSRTLRDFTFSPDIMNIDAQWITGFVDGEGCFFIGVNPHHEMTVGYQILPEFTVVQHKRDIQLLHALKEFFGCGVVRTNHGDRMAYRVRSVSHLIEKIIPFFEKHSLKSKKRQDFEKFRDALLLMQKGEHLKQEGIDQFRRIASQMNTCRER